METIKNENLNSDSLNRMDIKLNHPELIEVTLDDNTCSINYSQTGSAETTSENQLSLLDLVDGFYFKLNKDLTFQLVSFSILEKLGFSSQELTGKSFDEIFSEESCIKLRKIISEQTSSGEEMEKKHMLEVEVLDARNELNTYQLSLLGPGSIGNYIGICIDINKYKVREKELIAAKKTAEYNDSLKSEFLANMSHEIRTPLNGIVGFTAMLDREDLPDDKRQKYLRIINSSTQQLLSLVRDIIDISKIEARQLKIIRNRVDIHQMLEDLLATFVSEARRLEKDNIRIIKQLDKPSARLILDMDEVRLKQVLNNLLGNALKFTIAGEIRFGYTLMENNTIRFFVRDSGVGISKPAQKTIFDRFMQTQEGEKAIYKGTGLGLAISKGIIELMGGRIGVQSESGKGSEFYFTFPYTEGK
jgi:signal transduction histidine kinase